MKIAISLPDSISEEVERFIRRTRITRSRFFAIAAGDYLSRSRLADDPTDAWNRAIAAGGQPGDEPAAVALRKRAKQVVRRNGKVGRGPSW